LKRRVKRKADASSMEAGGQPAHPVDPLHPKIPSPCFCLYCYLFSWANAFDCFLPKAVVRTAWTRAGQPTAFSWRSVGHLTTARPPTEAVVHRSWPLAFRHLINLILPAESFLFISNLPSCYPPLL
jgi:hypothetical protein